MASPQFMTATTSFATELDGDPVEVHRNENIRSDHPIVEANPQYFKPVEISTRWDTVEQATAAPGEQRSTGRRRRPAGHGGVSEAPEKNITKETV